MNKENVGLFRNVICAILNSDIRDKERGVGKSHEEITGIFKRL